MEGDREANEGGGGFARSENGEPCRKTHRAVLLDALFDLDKAAGGGGIKTLEASDRISLFAKSFSIAVVGARDTIDGFLGKVGWVRRVTGMGGGERGKSVSMRSFADDFPDMFEQVRGRSGMCLVERLLLLVGVLFALVGAARGLVKVK